MRLPDSVQNLLNQFDVSDDKLRLIADKMADEFQLGLEFGKTATSSIAMLPTYVPALPEGSEKGQFIAIDLSGKNLRIMLLELRDGQNLEVHNANYIINESIMKGTGDQLFNFIVNCLHKFLKQFNLIDADLPIGFVFSYPCELLSIRSARLLWWTKGFDIKDCLQKDVVKLLENALDLNMEIRAKVKAVMNDTVGQIAWSSYKFGNECTMGVVVGYGCNSAYLERVSRIKKFDAHKANYKHENMVVVTEWEEFGDKGELDNILTDFDREVDSMSVHKGKQRIDKLTGALYLGELTRLILSQLAIDGVLFEGQDMPAKLQQPEGFPSKYINEILADADGTVKNCQRIMEELEAQLHGTLDYYIVKEVCHAVSKRSAALVAAAISALLRHMNRPRVKIGIGGALVQFHPTYHRLLDEKLQVLAPHNVQWELCKAFDGGSTHGAALVAAIANNMQL